MEAKRDMMKKVPVREQDPKVRATNFKEVCLGYNMEEAVAESERCLNCKNAKCIAGCPVSINIPAFIQEVKAGNIEEAAKVIALSSALPAVCGRVCPQESQCEGQCVRGEELLLSFRLFCTGSAGEDKRKESSSHRFRSCRSDLCRRSGKTGL